MAASQKKTGGKRTSSGGTRRSGSASGSSRGNSRGSKAPARRPMRREIGAAVCLALALFAALGYFHIQAIFIDFFSGLLKGLLGYGFWLMPPALLLAAYILAFHRGRPVRLRVTCGLLLPLLFSCIVHGLLGRVLPWDDALVKTLWAAGEELTSGGVLGGVLAQGSVQVFSRLGSTILFVLAFLLAGLGAFRLSLAEVADWIFDRPRYEYEPEEEPEPVVMPEVPIPVEDTPVVAEEPHVVVLPIQGEVLTAFSVDQLLYNETLDDWRTHDGVDIAAAEGDAVLAACAGTVSSITDDPLMGTTVVIQHSGGYETTYANLQAEPAVETGDTVSAGQTIGAVGTTAAAEAAQGAHLHFSVAKDGEAVDPDAFLNS